MKDNKEILKLEIPAISPEALSVFSIPLTIPPVQGPSSEGEAFIHTLAKTNQTE